MVGKKGADNIMESRACPTTPPRTQPTTLIVLCSPMGYPDFYPLKRLLLLLAQASSREDPEEIRTSTMWKNILIREPLSDPTKT